MPVTIISDRDGAVLELDMTDYSDSRPVTYAVEAVERAPGEPVPGSALRTITTHRERGPVELDLSVSVPRRDIEDVQRWLRARGAYTAQVVVPSRAVVDRAMLGTFTLVGTVGSRLEGILSVRELRVVESATVTVDTGNTSARDGLTDAEREAQAEEEAAAAEAEEADERGYDVGRTPIRADRVQDTPSATYVKWIGTPFGWLTPTGAQ